MSGHDRLARLVDATRESLWVVPATLGALAVLLAEILARSDVLRDDAIETGVFSGDADAARSVLATVATSALTVLGVTLTITLAVLALTAQAYSPRAIRRFLRDPVLQWVVGTFLATAAFSLMTLRQAQEGDVPALSVTLSIVFVFIALGFLVAFFHHVAREIRVESIIASIHADAIAALPAGRTSLPEATSARNASEPVIDVCARATGHVVWLDDMRIARLAAASGGSAEAIAGPGAWVRRGDPIVRLRNVGEGEHARLARRLSRAVSIATHRSIRQDPQFALMQLADIASRALSPSLNDSTTAREALERGGDILSRLSDRPLGSVVVELDGRVAYVRPLPSWESLCDTLVAEPRRTAEATASVVGMRTLLGVLRGCLGTDDPARLEVLRRCARQVAAAADRVVPDSVDRARIARDAEPVLGRPVDQPRDRSADGPAT